MSHYDEVVFGKTKTGNKVAYKVKDGDALYSIYFKNGGETPDILKGMWTDVRQIENAITKYLNKDKLCKPDQIIADQKKNLKDSKKRPSKLKLKKAVA